MDNAHIDRILHIAPTPFFSDRGCHIRISGLVRALNKLGVANRVCTYSLGRDQLGVESVRCMRIAGYTKTAAGPSMFKLIADPLLLMTTVSQILSYKPDVLHCHLHEGVLIGWLAKYIALRPKLTIGFDMQGGLSSELVSYGYLKNPMIRRFVYYIEKFIIARADLFYCSSKAVMQLLVNDFKVSREQISHVPDSADISLNNIADKPRNSIPVAIYTGGLTESKGLGMLQEIIHEASNRELDVNFLIVGYPTDQLQHFIDSNGIRNCTLTGRIKFEDLASYLVRATVAMEPKSGNTSEASGKLLNYMSAALPVVCFDTPNNQDFLGENGYFAKGHTAISFIDQLQLVIDHPKVAVARGLANSKTVDERFSWKSSAETILNMYLKTLSSNIALR